MFESLHDAKSVLLSLSVCCCGGLIGEDEQRHLRSLLLDVLDEQGNLHGAPDLLPDHADSRLVSHQSVHGDTVL